MANRLLVVAILAAVGVAILQTEPTVVRGREGWFEAAEIGFAAVFSAEYLVRLWTAAEIAEWGGGWRARLRWMITPAAILDLLAIAPVLFAGGSAAYTLRLVRLLRLLRLAKLGRFSRAYRALAAAVWSRRHELLVTLSVGLVVLILASTLLYLVEGDIQPKAFGSIPRALWWGAVTLTTIGYGDAYPVTPLGKLLAALTALTGIGLVAAPAGILAAAFTEHVAALKKGETSSQEDR